MTISLTCACGARLEIDEAFAGQTINCPDCQRPLKTPRPERAGIQTSGFALTSLILALAGAFTLLGTVLAVVFGALGLRDIARRPEEVTGKGFAVAGIALGVALTAVTAFVLVTPEFFGVSGNNLLGRFQWADKLDYPDDLEVKKDGFTIKRPSAKWGVKRDHVPQGWEAQRAQVATGEVLLVNLDEDAHLLCYSVQGGQQDLNKALRTVLDEFSRGDRAGIFSGGKPTTRTVKLREVEPPVRKKEGNRETWQVTVDKSLSGQNRRFLIRVVRNDDANTPAYALIGGTRVARFDRLKEEIEGAMNSFKFVEDVPQQ
jgi:hypothetical protein